MKSCTFELLVNILTYAIKNKDTTFSQKDFKNVVYTKEFNNFDINDKIADGCDYLLKRGLLQLKNDNMTYFEKYKLPETIIVDTENYTKFFKELSKKIILMYEGKEMINETSEVKSDYAEIIEAVDIVNSGFLSDTDQERVKKTLSKILVSLNVESKAHYSLLTIIQLLELKSEVIIKIKTNSCEFAAQNVRFHKLLFNEDSIILYFDKCSFNIDSIENILHIDLIDELELLDHIDGTLSLLEKYPAEETERLSNFLQDYKKEYQSLQID